jgi:hypothetical protein
LLEEEEDADRDDDGRADEGTDGASGTSASGIVAHRFSFATGAEALAGGLGRNQKASSTNVIKISATSPILESCYAANISFVAVPSAPCAY